MLKEDTIQAEIYKWFHNNYCAMKQCVIFSVPNGGTRNKMEAIKLKATGLVAGVSDLIILMPNKCIFVEVKAERGVQSEKQKFFENKVKLLGFDYFIVRSLDEFKQKIEICTPIT